jgi:hypothetical protein
MRSFITVICIGIVLLGCRMYYSDLNQNTPLQKPLMVTTWDALGYYLYLPAAIIHKDVTELAWFPETDRRYELTGGHFYQAGRGKNGKYVFKYAGGVALLELPFFLAAHAVAPALGYPADGFSSPYQYALAFGLVFWCIASLFLLRVVLLRYFSDTTTAFTLLLLLLASNAIQYISAESAQSHGWIFPLYVGVLYTTIRWHEQPRWHWAFLTGIIIGIATMSRPTEAIMLFIPLLWKRQEQEAFKEKWQFLMQKKAHIAAIITGGIIGFLPQMIYWKIATGSFLYTMGSKWQFLNPWFRVLFGWEKGWFIYTPVTILFVAGLFFLRQYPFRKSVLTFCLLNIYIVISWSDWRYGGSYASRALMQSYPVFALALAAVLERISATRWYWTLYPVSIWLTGVNLFQVEQYNRAVLHYNDMNRAYYARIFLNPHPTALDMSLLDTGEWPPHIGQTVVLADTILGEQSRQPDKDRILLASVNLPGSGRQERWLKIEANIRCDKGFWDAHLSAVLPHQEPIKSSQIRLSSPINKAGIAGEYAFFFKVPAGYSGQTAEIYLLTPGAFEGAIQRLKVSEIVQ